MTVLLRCVPKFLIHITNCYTEWAVSSIPYRTHALIEDEIAVFIGICTVNPRWQHLLLSTGIYCVHDSVKTAQFEGLSDD